ncbi:MAG: polysaccharide deacetylase family protein [Acidobacteriota bacterium]
MSWRQNTVRMISEANSILRMFSGTKFGYRVLMYHSVGTDLKSDPLLIYSIKPGLFEDHMRILSQHPDVDLVNFTDGTGETNKIELAVTFDDGYKDNLTTAAPIMQKYGIPFTVFVTTSFLASKDSLYMSRNELKELASCPGATIGAHGITHTPLSECDDFTLMAELIDSKNSLEDLLGQSIITMGYPFGAVDRRVRNAVKEVGYQRAGCSRFDINGPERDPLLLCRSVILAQDSERVFLQKLRGDWDWYRWRDRDPLSI